MVKSTESKRNRSLASRVVSKDLKPEIRDILEKIKEMRLDNSFVNQSITIQEIQGLSDFETVILLADGALKSLEDTRKALKVCISERSVNPAISQKDEVDIAYRVLQWMIFSGKYDDVKASNIRKMLIPLFGEKIIEEVKERYLTA